MANPIPIVAASDVRGITTDASPPTPARDDAVAPVMAHARCASRHPMQRSTETLTATGEPSGRVDIGSGAHEARAMKTRALIVRETWLFIYSKVTQ